MKATKVPVIRETDTEKGGYIPKRILLSYIKKKET